MRKQVIIIAIVVFLVSAGLTLFIYNPFNTEKNKFIGTWMIGNETMDLFSNGKCSTNTSQGLMGWYGRWYGRWVLKDNLFVTVINGDVGLLTTAYYYEFTNNDRTLLLTKTIDGSTDVYSKQ
jgi:hypothetical protein